MDLDDVLQKEMEKMVENEQVKSLCEYYYSFLEQEGYKPYFLEDGFTIIFQNENNNYALQFYENNFKQCMFSLNLGHPYNIETKDKFYKVLTVSNFVNRMQTIGKFWINPKDSSVNAVISSFINNKDDLKFCFTTCCTLLKEMFVFFEENTKE